MAYFDEIKKIIKDNKKEYFRLTIENTLFAVEGRFEIEYIDEKKVQINTKKGTITILGSGIRVMQSSRYELIAKGEVISYAINKD